MWQDGVGSEKKSVAEGEEAHADRQNEQLMEKGERSKSREWRIRQGQMIIQRVQLIAAVTMV